MEKSAKIYIAGHTGLVGSAVVEELQKQGYTNLLTTTRAETNLTDPHAVDAFFAAHKPDYVFLCAAKVGGIWANKTQKADFLRDNIYITTNIIASAQKHGVTKLLNLGSTCIYPRNCPQPIKEEYLLTGPLEETNDAYAIAKISGILLGQAYRQQYGFKVISAQPTNLYGPRDNFHPEHGHVIPGMMVRMLAAKERGDASFPIWGTGAPLREFLYSEDLARALILLMNTYDEAQHINVGTQAEVTIKELAHLIAQTIGYTGELAFDTSKPDGTMRKVTDSSKLFALGWQPQVSLPEGLKNMYAWYLANKQSARAA